MKRRILSHFLTALAASALLFTGCETTENRISQNQTLFNSLSPSDQALVSRGQIRSGMSQQTVWLAWGNPENKTHGEMRGRATETWIYVQTTTAPYGSAYYPFYGYGAGPYFGGGFGGGGFVTRHHHGRSFFFYGDPFYDPFYYSYIPPTISIPYKTVTFSNGRVVSWQLLTR